MSLEIWRLQKRENDEGAVGHGEGRGEEVLYTANPKKGEDIRQGVRMSI